MKSKPLLPQENFSSNAFDHKVMHKLNVNPQNLKRGVIPKFSDINTSRNEETEEIDC